MDVYGVRVLVIPPNRPIKRRDLKDLYFRDAAGQLQAAVWAALELHWTGRPILIVVSTIGETELVSEQLIKEKIPHNVLNANNAAWEAEIIKEAGQKNAVTVSTSMAGRGTDIKLGEGVEELGGLAVIGIGRMPNSRLERQARGRAGRQGDAGSSRFFVSIQDETVKNCEPQKLEKYIEGRKKISRRRMKKIVDKAQALGEEMAVLSRKHATNYDRVVQRQRDLIYATRNHLLDGGEVRMEKVMEIAGENIRRFLDSQTGGDGYSLNRYVLDHISYRLDKDITDLASEISDGGLSVQDDSVERCLLEKVERRLAEQEKILGNRERMNEFMRVAVLNAVDSAWVEQVDYLQQLQAAVAGRATAQRNLLFEYQADAFESFGKMERTIKENAVRNILLSDVYVDEGNKLHILFP